MDMVTSDVIYTIDKSRQVIGLFFFTVNNDTSSSQK